MQNKVVKSSIFLITLTIVSKVLGVLRETALAYYYGASIETDAYVVAQSCCEVLIAGLVGAVITGLTREVIAQKDDNVKIASILKTTTFLLEILATTLVLILLIKPSLIIKLFAAGFNQEAIDITSKVIYFMAPTLIFQIITTTLKSYLNSKEDFTIDGLTNVVANIFILIGIITSNHKIYILGFGHTIGQVVLTLIAFIRSKRHGLPFYKIKPASINSEEMKNILLMATPLMICGLLNNINPIVDRTFASMLSAGTISSLNYANKINIIFYSTFVTTVNTALFPKLAKTIVVNNDLDEYKNVSIKAQTILQMLAVPAVFGMYILSEELVKLVFLRGAFDSVALSTTVGALKIYAWYLPAISILTIYNNAFYALGDTKIPAIIATASAAFNVILNITFIKPFGYKGLALATVIANILSMVFCVLLLRKKIGPMGLGKLVKNEIKIIISSIIMSAIVFLFMQPIMSVVEGKTAFIRIFAVGVLAIIGVIVYCFVLKLMKLSEYEEAILTIKGFVNKKINKSY